MTDFYLVVLRAGSACEVPGVTAQGQEGWQKGLRSSQTPAANVLPGRGTEGFRYSVKRSLI